MLEFQIEIPRSYQEILEGVLYLEGEEEFVIEDETTGLLEGHKPLPEGKIRFLLYHSHSIQSTLAPKIQALIKEVSFLETQIQPEKYQERWKEFFKPAKISPRLWIRPSWEELPRVLTPEEKEVIIDPGSAFGTGLHETTKLCVAALDRLTKKGSSLLDVGTGSGILAIAAARFGAASITAIDNDPLAIIAAEDNLKRNQIKGVFLSQKPLEEIDEEFSLVVANILASTLFILKKSLWSHVAPDGYLLLSGLLATELSLAKTEFLHKNSYVEREEVLGEWGFLCLRRIDEHSQVGHSGNRVDKKRVAT